MNHTHGCLDCGKQWNHRLSSNDLCIEDYYCNKHKCKGRISK